MNAHRMLNLSLQRSERVWYRALDIVQWPWHKFSTSRIGRGSLWAYRQYVTVIARIIWILVKITVKVMKHILIWSFVIGMGVALMTFKFAFKGNGKKMRFR